MFDKAKVNWRHFEKEGDTKTALVLGILITDSVKGEKDFKVKIKGDDLQEIVTAQDQEAKGMEVVKRVLTPRYLEWVNDEKPIKTTETIDGNPEFTSLD